MRKRRADHCLLRAAAALDAEFPEAAESVLNEARQLCPSHPGLDDVSARLLSTDFRPQPRVQHGAFVWLVMLTACLIAATILLH